MMKTAQLPIPCFDVENRAEQEFAREQFAALGAEVPMVAVHFADMGGLARLADRTEARPLTAGRAEDFRRLAKRAFIYLAGSRVLPLTVSFSAGSQLQFYPEAYSPALNVAYTDDAVAHNDAHTAGAGGMVYGVHLTPFGGGRVEAANAILAPQQPEPFEYYSEAPFLTHGRDFVSGDMHIFVRQTPSPAFDQRTLRPTTHLFTKSVGIEKRGFIQQGFGLRKVWKNVKDPEAS